MFRITREIHFCYGHRLLNYDGKCRHLHGHNGKAQIVLEVRSGGLGIDRYDQLIGIPSILFSGSANAVGSAPFATPELAIVKSTRQKGYASVAFVAYWNDDADLKE